MAFGSFLSTFLPDLRAWIPLAWEVRARAQLGGIGIDHSVRLAMPDGTELAASLYLPRAARSSPPTPLPTVYIRLPYDRLNYDEALRSALWFAQHDYAVLIQDLRGKFGSQGRFAPWEHATSDGAATLDWITGQPWSNGRVGTFGCSALGETQYSLARAQHPAQAAMIASGAGGAWGSPLPNLDQGGFHEGGVLQLASTFGWSLEHGAQDPTAPKVGGVDLAAALRTLPLQDMVKHLQPGSNVFTDYLRLAPDDPAWARFELVRRNDKIPVPALVINTWGDQTIAGTLELAEQARRGYTGGNPDHQHVIIAPGNHCDYIGTMRSGRFGELTVGNTQRPYGEWFLRWFEHHLRGNGPGLADLPPYQYYVIGEDRWLAATQWPPRESRIERWTLGSDGRANSRAGNGWLAREALTPTAASGTSSGVNSGASSDRFISDPTQPVPSRGGPICCTGNPAEVSGPAEQAELERREDVLVYTSPPLRESLRIAGTLSAHLLVSSTAPDTDFVARLVHVWPDGRATSIQEGALRARYRDGARRAAPMETGRRYVLTVPMRSIAYYFPKGHRLRLHIAGSSFPRLERNLNTGGNNYDESVGRPAHNTVHYGADSYLELMVLDDERAVDAR